MTDRRLAQGLIASWIAAAILVALAPSCGATPQQSARHFVDGAGEVFVVTDRAFAIEYTAQARRALAASADLASYRSAMEPFDAVEQGLRVAQRALELGDAAVLVWTQGGVNDWAQAQQCIVGALVGLRDLLEAAGAALPPELVAFLDGVHAVVDTDQCFLEGT